MVVGEKMLEKIFESMLTHVPGRRQMIRLSRALMNMALGDNNDDIESNGELLLLRRILDSIPKEVSEFIVFDVGANVGQWTIFC